MKLKHIKLTDDDTKILLVHVHNQENQDFFYGGEIVLTEEIITSLKSKKFKKKEILIGATFGYDIPEHECHHDGDSYDVNFYIKLSNGYNYSYQTYTNAVCGVNSNDMEFGFVSVDDDIKINEIEETTCELYTPNDILIGSINSELVLNDVRIQIIKKGVYGYYIKWQRKVIKIDKYGNLENWPEGFYGTNLNQLMEMLYGDKEEIEHNDSASDYIPEENA